jgi:hypothetical protein
MFRIFDFGRTLTLFDSLLFWSSSYSWPFYCTGCAGQSAAASASVERECLGGYLSVLSFF